MNTNQIAAELGAVADNVLDIIDQGDTTDVWRRALRRFRAALAQAREAGVLPASAYPAADTPTQFR